MVLSYKNFGGAVLTDTSTATLYIASTDSVGSQLFGTSAGEQYSTNGLDTLSGGSGDDTYVISGKGVVVIEGVGGGIDKVNAWMDYVLPANVENLVVQQSYTGVGNALNNIISGVAGNQELNGAGGDDVLIGGAGRDSFIFTTGSGKDVVMDFQVGAGGDYARVGAYGFSSLAQVQSKMVQNGADVVLTLSDTDAILFKNTKVADFTRDNFQLKVDYTSLSGTFSEEFNTLSLYNGSSGTWKPYYGFGTQTGLDSHTLTANKEQEIYVDPTFKGSGTTALGLNPFSVHDGVLDITAAKTTAAQKAVLWNYDYTSGILTTQKTFAQTYGYFEMRADIPTGKGLWPAFWLLPADESYSSELDVMEHVGDGNVHTTAHNTGASGHTQTTFANFMPELTEGFHTYGVSWTAETIRWYVDGVEVSSAATPANMNRPMYMLVNLAAGGTWPGSVDPAMTSATLTVDYIRAYSINPDLPPATPAPEQPTSPVIPDLVLTGTAGVDNLIGGAGDDTLDGKGGADVVTGGAGDDIYYVDGLDSVVELANGGTDTAYSGVTYILPANVENLVQTMTGKAVGIGNALNNVMTGNPGDNHLDGAAGADTLIGGLGSDTLIGGAGNDYLTGGDGADVFIYKAYAGFDTISDFGVGGDRLDLSAFGTRTATLTDSGSDVLITLSSTESIRLIGVHASDLIFDGTGYTHI